MKTFSYYILIVFVSSVALAEMMPGQMGYSQNPMYQQQSPYGGYGQSPYGGGMGGMGGGMGMGGMMPGAIGGMGTQDVEIDFSNPQLEKSMEGIAKLNEAHEEKLEKIREDGQKQSEMRAKEFEKSQAEFAEAQKESDAQFLERLKESTQEVETPQIDPNEVAYFMDDLVELNRLHLQELAMQSQRPIIRGTPKVALPQPGRYLNAIEKAQLGTSSTAATQTQVPPSLHAE